MNSLNLYKIVKIIIPLTILSCIFVFSIKMNEEDKFSTDAQRNFFINNYLVTIEGNKLENLNEIFTESNFSKSISKRGDWDELKVISPSVTELEKIFKKFKIFFQKYPINKVFIAFNPSAGKNRWTYLVTFELNPLYAIESMKKDFKDFEVSETFFAKDISTEIKIIRGEYQIYLARKKNLFVIANFKESLIEFFKNVPANTSKGFNQKLLRSDLTVWINFEELRKTIVNKTDVLDDILPNLSLFLNIFKDKILKFSTGRLDIMIEDELSICGEFHYYSPHKTREIIHEKQYRQIMKCIPGNTISIAFRSVDVVKFWEEIYNEAPLEEKGSIDKDIQDFEKFLGNEKDFKKDFLEKIGQVICVLAVPRSNVSDPKTLNCDLAIFFTTDIDELDKILADFFETIEKEDPDRFLSENLQSFSLEKISYRGFDVYSLVSSGEKNFAPSFCQIDNIFVISTSQEGLNQIINAYYQPAKILPIKTNISSFYWIEGVELRDSLIKSIDFIAEMIVNARYVKDVVASVDNDFARIYTEQKKAVMKEKFKQDIIKKGETPTEDLLEMLVSVKISNERTKLIEGRMQKICEAENYKAEINAEREQIRKKIIGSIFFEELTIWVKEENNGLSFEWKIK